MAFSARRLTFASDHEMLLSVGDAWGEEGTEAEEVVLVLELHLPYDFTTKKTTARDMMTVRRFSCHIDRNPSSASGCQSPFIEKVVGVGNAPSSAMAEVFLRLLFHSLCLNIR